MYHRPERVSTKIYQKNQYYKWKQDQKLLRTKYSRDNCPLFYANNESLKSLGSVTRRTLEV